MKTYGCFVIFHYGISGRFFNALKSKYSNDKLCIKVEGKITNAFLANQGVRQGCPLRPLLFNISWLIFPAGENKAITIKTN